MYKCKNIIILTCDCDVVVKLFAFGSRCPWYKPRDGYLLFPSQGMTEIKILKQCGIPQDNPTQLTCFEKFDKLIINQGINLLIHVFVHRQHIAR